MPKLMLKIQERERVKGRLKFNKSFLRLAGIIFCVAFLGFQFIPVRVHAADSWYNASWQYRKKITFDNSAQAENLTNFPVLIKLDSSNFDYNNYII